jgi:hypothetical protein
MRPACSSKGHDVIVEPYAPQGDVVVPVIGAEGAMVLPVMRFTLRMRPTISAPMKKSARSPRRPARSWNR